MPSLLDREEIYLSGLASPSIRKSRLNPRCLGVYVTNKRIFVVSAPFWMQIMYLPSLFIAAILELSALGIVFSTIVFSILQASASQASSGVQGSVPFAVFILEWVGLAFLFEGILTGWYRNSSVIPIQELEKRSVYQIDKVQVSKIEFDRHVFLPSHIEITSSTGERFSILFAEGGSFDRAKRAIRT
jgi:hypothetical protein